MDCLLQYNNTGLTSKVSEVVATKNAENFHHQQPYCCFTRVIGLHFCCW